MKRNNTADLLHVLAVLALIGLALALYGCCLTPAPHQCQQHPAPHAHACDAWMWQIEPCPTPTD